MKRAYLLIFISVLVGLFLTCVAHRSQEMANWYAPKEDRMNQQIQAAMDLLNENPSAAGKKYRNESEITTNQKKGEQP